MSSGRITKPETRHSWRLGLAVLLFLQVWGFWPLNPFRRIAGLLTGYVYDVALSIGTGRYAAVLITLFATCLIVFFVCRFYGLRLVVTVGCLILIFAENIFHVVTRMAKPAVLWPTLLWVVILLALILLRTAEGLRWFSLLVPAAVLSFWFYDSVVRLLATLEILPDFGALWPNPTMSHTFNLDGFLGLPGSVFVILPALSILAVILTYREADAA